MAKKLTIDDIKEFAHANKHLLLIVGNPVTDELFVGYNDLNSFVRFSADETHRNIILQTLLQSRFASTIDEFTTGFMELLAIKPDHAASAQLIKLVGGAMFAIGDTMDLQEISKSKKVEKKVLKNKTKK